MKRIPVRFVNFTTRASLCLWIVFFSLYWMRGFQFSTTGSIYAKSLGVWADGAAHLTYISAMAYRIPLDSPIYLGKPFVYPFVADGLSAVLVRLGVNIFLAYSIIGLLLSTIFVLSLYWFYNKILKSTVLSSLSVYIFLLSGGVGFVKFLKEWSKVGGVAPWQAVSQEFTLIPEWHIRWINIVTAELIPQRAFLLALPLGLVPLFWYWKVLSNKKTTWLHTFISALILGTLPVIHPHTYIVFGILGLWVATCVGVDHINRINDLKKSVPSTFLHLCVLGVISLIISVPIIVLHILPASDTQFFRPMVGWLAKEAGVPWLWWWFLNTGVFLPLVLLGWFRSNIQIKLFGFGFLIVFVFANSFVFQPYDWDNSKLITWCFLGFSPFAAVTLKNFWAKNSVLSKMLAGVIFGSLIFSGSLDVVRQLQKHTSLQMFTKEDLQLVDWVKSNTSAKSIFLTSDVHIHPIPTLAGRQIVMGYPGWLWSYGIDYTVREKNIKKIYQMGDEDLLQSYQVDYVLLGPHERVNLEANEAVFEKRYEKVYQSSNYKIFKTR